MNILEQTKKAKEFAARWSKREGYEKGETQRFWIDLLSNVFGEADATEKITFEDRVQLGHKSFIDAHIPGTKVLIEQKGAKVDLKAEAKQSDGTRLTPFEQAKRYADELPLSEKPRWIVVCNFMEFHVHDMERPRDEPTVITLDKFEKEFHYLSFLTNPENVRIHKELDISVEAGEIVGKLYNALSKAYDDNSPEALKALNVLCVRLVFCLYAEDAGLFPKHLQFLHYLNGYPAGGLRKALIELFRILDTPESKRSRYEEEKLLEFPYVNGGLFSAHELEIPQFTEEMKDILLKEASSDFDWSDISPTIFGAVFESTLNPASRRGGGYALYISGEYSQSYRSSFFRRSKSRI